MTSGFPISFLNGRATITQLRNPSIGNSLQETFGKEPSKDGKPCKLSNRSRSKLAPPLKKIAIPPVLSLLHILPTRQCPDDRALAGVFHVTALLQNARQAGHFDMHLRNVLVENLGGGIAIHAWFIARISSFTSLYPSLLLDSNS